MQTRHPIITYAYHFLSEALIIFLAALPVMHIYYNFVPYWSYILASVSISFLFSFFAMRSPNYGPYIISAPFIIVLFYLLNFPLVMSIGFGLVLIWRYINIRAELKPNRENSYIRWALVLSTITVLMINEQELILYVFLLFIIIIFGYISGHLAVIHRNDRKRFDRKFWLYIMSGLVIGTTVIYFSFSTVRFFAGIIWAAISNIIIFVGGMLVQLLESMELFGFEHDPDYEDPEELGGNANQIPEEFAESDPFLFELVTTIIMWVIIASIIGFIIWWAYRMYQRRFQSPKHDQAGDVVSYGSLEKDKSRRDNVFQRFMKKYFQTPNNPIRKMVYEFERKAAQSNYGRYKYETIENWTRRIGLEAQLETYQDVRYGQMNVSDDDVQQLKQQLKEIEALFEDDNEAKPPES